jgi:hypothetical protein
MSRPIKSKISFSWSFVKSFPNSGRRSYSDGSVEFSQEGDKKPALRRNAEANDAKTKWPVRGC